MSLTVFLLCESKNREHFDLILTFSIVQQPVKSHMKPQINYRYSLRFSFLVRDWLFTWNTITFHKYF